MATKDGVPATMAIGGKTFNLAGLISESVLDQQMANVFKVLKKLSSLIETQASQIQALQTKVLEIDPLAQRISSMHAWQESTADRLNRIEEKLTRESKETEAVKVRVSDLESRFAIIGQVQKEMKDTNDRFAEVEKKFAQLTLDARDALTLSSDVKHFKMEMQELQEDVTTVLHQAPSTERLIAQVQLNVDASTEQLMTMSSKTAFMESTMAKMSTTVDEFKHMKTDLNRRLTTLENPKIDRLGILENQSRGMAKQVSLLQHNWMTNWGAHEQSMQMLKDEIMLHINQLRMQGAGGATAGDGQGLTFVRMDEEEKAALRKQMDQCHRDINRLDNKKADFAMVMKLLEDKADSEALAKKMDTSDFEQRMAELHNDITRAVLQEHQAEDAVYSGVDRPLTAGSMRSSLDQISSESHLADEMHQPGLEDPAMRSMASSKPKQQQRRPASTPPVLPGSVSGMDRGGGQAKGSKTTIRYTSTGQQVAYEPMAQPLANRRLSAHDARHSGARCLTSTSVLNLCVHGS